MHIVIVGGGTAGWMTGLMLAKRHPDHKVTLIESSSIGIIGVGESTTGLLSDLLNNYIWDFGCDHNEFIRETGASLKYGIRFKGWTPDIEDYYIGPIDGSITKQSTPDVMFAYAIKNLPKKDIIKASRIGNWIARGKSNFSKKTKDFSSITHAMHVDAYLVGKYFQKIATKLPNVTHIDAKVVDSSLDDRGFIKHVILEDHKTIDGDFFIDCSGMSRLLVKKMPGNNWISYTDNLPVNSAIPFLLEYRDGEIPPPYTTAWAQNSGWMWQIPLLDRIGCGYVFDNNFITPDRAHEEIEKRLERKINPIKTIKFTTGRQSSFWINNCLTIGLASAFLEPLEATSIHSTLVQIKNFVFDYLKSTPEETINFGSINIYNQRTRQMFDDLKDFISLHYQGGRTDTEFWKHISTDVPRTDFVRNLIEMSKYRLPNHHDFTNYYGSAGWPLYSYILEGLGLIKKEVAIKELDMTLSNGDSLETYVRDDYYAYHEQWHEELQDHYSWTEMIEYFRSGREKHEGSNR